MLHRQSKTKGLVLPTNYELISEDEARQISGGIQPKRTPFGLQVYLSNDDVNRLSVAMGAGSAAAWFATELSAAGVVTIPGSVPLGIIAAGLALTAAGIEAMNAANGFNGVTLFFPCCVSGLRVR